MNEPDEPKTDEPTLIESKTDEPTPKASVDAPASSAATESRGATPAELARFLGVWELDPSRSVYEVGGAPQRATYVLETVEHDGAHALRIRMAWVSAEGESLSLALAAPVDGIARPLVAPTVSTDAEPERPSSVRPPAPIDTLGFDLVDERTLDSMAYRGQEPRAHVRRVVSEDGRELHIVQTFTMDDRLQLVNESWYVRG